MLRNENPYKYGLVLCIEVEYNTSIIFFRKVSSIVYTSPLSFTIVVSINGISISSDI